MRGRALFLPVFTAAAVLLAVSLPMGTLQQWDRNYQDVLHQESVDEDALVTNYTLSGSDRLHLLRYSGISARNGEIHYENPVGVSRWRCGRWSPLHPWKLAGKTMSAKIPFPTVIF